MCAENHNALKCLLASYSHTYAVDVAATAHSKVILYVCVCWCILLSCACVCRMPGGSFWGAVQSDLWVSEQSQVWPHHREMQLYGWVDRSQLPTVWVTHHAVHRLANHSASQTFSNILLLLSFRTSIFFAAWTFLCICCFRHLVFFIYFW